MLPITDLFAGAATRTGRGLASSPHPGVGPDLRRRSVGRRGPTPAGRRRGAARAQSGGFRAAELVHRRPRQGRHLLLAPDEHRRRQRRSNSDSPGATISVRPQRGQEATPIVVDGVMYTSGTWGYVYAVDAATGKELWRYDPKADWFSARNPCCDLVNRGVAVWKGKVYVASVDGRLHALDAATGKKSGRPTPSSTTSCPIRAPARRRSPATWWSSATAARTWGTAAVRGYVSAYDLATGALQMAFLHGAAGAGPAARESGARRGGQDLGSAPRAAVQGRRHGLGRIRLRSRLEAGLFRHGQRGALRPAPARRRASSTGSTPPRSSRCMPTPGGWPGTTRPRRATLGLRRRAEIDAGGPEHRRRRPAGAHAGQQERLLLRARPQDRQAAVRQELHATSTGPRAST